MLNQLKSTKLSSYRIKVSTTNILGIKVNFISLFQTLLEVENFVNYNKQGQITTPNPEHIVMAQNDYRMKEIINQSWLSVADGVGLVWAAQLLDSKLSQVKPGRNKCFFTSILKKNKKKTQWQRLAGVDLMIGLCKLAARKKWRVFLLGGRNQSAALAAAKLKNKNKKLEINFFNGSRNIVKETKIERIEAIKRINQFKPHLLFVAYGAPFQEKWIAANLKKLKVNVAMGVGGAFDYLAGGVKRAPKWMRNSGLEWLWRLIKEPWRAKRQLRLVKFIYLVIKERLFT